MNHPKPFRNRKPFSPDGKLAGRPKRFESPWKRAWRLAPERMRDHLNQMNKARSAKSEETAELVKALFDMLPVEPMQPYVFRDNIQKLWKECYSEEKTKQESWNLVRLAMRKGFIGKLENGLIFPRKG